MLTDSKERTACRPLRALGASFLIAIVAGCGGPEKPATQSPSPPPAPGATSNAGPADGATVATVRVDTSPASARGSFVPDVALGAGVDRLPRAASDALFSPASLERILSAGWGPVTYRLNTELHMEAWHWNPNGTWSDPSGRGYFTGSAAPGEPIRHSKGYPLPRRGTTHNEGTEEHGFSRLMDGDPRTLWKSNPYLAPRFTQEDETATFPQWVVLDLGKSTPVDALRIDWAAPYARRVQVQYWTGEDAIKKPGRGEWRDFPGGTKDHGTGGSALIRFAPAPMDARFVRIVLHDSSGTCEPRASRDPRDCVGFAIRELAIGTVDAKGTLVDVAHHSADQSQTATVASSVDPWHEPANVQPHDGDQTGLDLFYTSGVTRGLPAMIPVAVVYGTPEDSAAEIAYVEKKGYPISYVELGEEADGQYMTPEHYAALYLQWATALHRVDPKLKLGGPAFTSSNEDIQAWPDAHGKTSWFGRFLDYLRSHGRLEDLAFMSFEHYPYEPCKYAFDDLRDEPRLIGRIMQAWRDDGLPPSVPIFITEVNIAWQSDGPFVDVFGGLWLADYVGAFFAAGGAGTFYFHYMPLPLGRQCGTAGGFTMFSADEDFRLRQPLSQYFASRLVSQEWAQPGNGTHVVFPAASDVIDAKGRAVVTAYALHRPDGEWSLLLVNKDADTAHSVRIAFDGAAAKSARHFEGTVAVTSFGADNYVWHPSANGEDGTADPDGPPAASKQVGGEGAVYVLPRASVTVVRGRIGEDSRPD